MSKLLNKYLPFTRAGIQESFAYKANFICFLLGDILMCFISFFLWNAIFESGNSQTFMGFTHSDMVVYIFISYLTTMMTFSDGAYVVGEEIREGSFAMRMIKPISFDITFLFQELGNKILIAIIVFFPIIIGVEIYRFVTTGVVMFNIVNFLLYVISLCFAYLVNFYFNVCYGYSAFILKNLWGANILKNTVVGFLSGATIPLAFMPAVMRNIFQILPFASLVYTPVMIYMGMYSPLEIALLMGLQVIWIAAFYGIQKLIWNLSIKRLCIQGG